MSNTKFFIAAALPFALMAAPAFAQDASSATSAETMKEKVETPAEVTVKDPVAIEAPEKTMTSTDAEMPVSKDGMMIKGEEVMTENKDMMVKGKVETMDAPVMDKPAMEAPELDVAPAPAAPEIACPEGTEAQADGTCMMTGE